MKIQQSALDSRSFIKFLFNISLALLLMIPSAKADQVVWNLVHPYPAYTNNFETRGSSPFNLCDSYINHVRNLYAPTLPSHTPYSITKGDKSWYTQLISECNADPLQDISSLNQVVKYTDNYSVPHFYHTCIPRFESIPASPSICSDAWLSLDAMAEVNLSTYSCQYGLNLTTGECNNSSGGNNNGGGSGNTNGSNNDLKNIGNCESVGNPINPNIGNKFQIETDYAGAGLFPLTLTRTYNSISLYTSPKLM